ncbi:MAG: serine O-acetyltransferase EpsC [Fimbriimonas sp.]
MRVSDSPSTTLVEHLARRRRKRTFPTGVRPKVRLLIEQILGLLYPHFSESTECGEGNIECEIETLRQNLAEIAESLWSAPEETRTIAIEGFLAALPQIDQALTWDAEALLQGDPAAGSLDEVISTYPGFLAIAIHRVAHWFYVANFTLLPRLLSEYAHRETGIDIHPGASIGRGFVIDHGTGVVIGETTHIGNGVKLYQGVTLGALSVAKSLADTKRHPTLEDNVVVYSNATILGGQTTIGHDSIVGGNAWITESVPPFSVVGRNSEVRPRKAGSDSGIEFHI